MNPIALAICFPRDAGGSQHPPGRLSGGAISLLRGERSANPAGLAANAGGNAMPPMLLSRQRRGVIAGRAAGIRGRSSQHVLRSVIEHRSVGFLPSSKATLNVARRAQSGVLRSLDSHRQRGRLARGRVGPWPGLSLPRPGRSPRRRGPPPRPTPAFERVSPDGREL